MYSVETNDDWQTPLQIGMLADPAKDFSIDNTAGEEGEQHVSMDVALVPEADAAVDVDTLTQKQMLKSPGPFKDPEDVRRCP